MKSAVKSEDLADVTAQDLKRAPYTLILDKSQLITDELAWSKAWMNANLTGLGGGHSVHLTWAARIRNRWLQRLSFCHQRRTVLKDCWSPHVSSVHRLRG